MALRETIYDTDIDLFRQELVNLIDVRHGLCPLAGRIDSKALKCQFGGLYAAGVGRPGHPICLMVGLQLLKETLNKEQCFKPLNSGARHELTDAGEVADQPRLRGLSVTSG